MTAWREGDPVAYIMVDREAVYEYADGTIRRNNGCSLTDAERDQIAELPRVPTRRLTELTTEEKVQFRKDWDARVVKGQVGPKL